MSTSVTGRQTDRVLRPITYVGFGLGLLVLFALSVSSSWVSGVEIHTLSEVVAMAAALGVAALALTQFRSDRSNTLLFVGTGFLGTALLDGYHAVVTSSHLARYLPSGLPSLIPWSWVASRAFLSLFLWLSVVAWRIEATRGEAGRVKETGIYALAGVLTLGSFFFFAFVPLPRAYYPELVLHRPQELVPALFFGLALAGYLRKGLWRADPLEYSLVVSLIVGVATQGLFMPRSGMLFDAMFDLAHWLKVLSYVLVVIGLLVSTHYLFVRATRSAEARLRVILNSTAVGIITIDESGLVQTFNTMAERLFGYRAEEIIGKNVSLLMPSPYHEEHDGYLARYHRTGEFRIIGRERELEGRRKDGSTFPIALRVCEMKLNGNRGYVGSIQDTRQRSQEGLAEAQRIAHLGSWDWDIVTKELWWSDENYRILGFEPDEVRPTRELFCERVHPDDRGEVEAAVQRALEGPEDYGIAHRVVRADGSVRVAHSQGEVHRDSAGVPVRMLGTMHDITEQRALENQLRQSQKLEAIGRLAGGVAHDFNNLIAVIRGYAEMTLRKLGPDHSLGRNLGEIVKSTERAAKLTRQMLAFSRQQVLEPRVLDLASVIDQAQGFLGRVIGEDIEVETLKQAGVGRVRADPTQLEQILMNLAVNARDAMPEGGRLTLEVTEVRFEDPEIRGEFVVPPGRYVMLAVSDTGCGMDEHTQAHIFEPFFTTKGPGEGTGLGLATVYGIVKQSGGYIWVYSEVGHGTTFKIFLPRVEEAPDPEQKAQVAEAGRATGSETVLLVEDEDALRELLVEVLAEPGYRVLEARDPAEALRISDGHPDRIHILVTDVVMPGMSGPNLAVQMRSRQPGLRVLFMSGYSEGAMASHDLFEDGTAFIHKPFSRDTLTAMVRQVLDSA